MILDRQEIVNKRRQRKREKRNYKYNWHPWYAWYPVEVPLYSGNWVWLEYIERKYYCNLYETTGFFGGPAFDISSGWRRRMKKS